MCCRARLRKVLISVRKGVLTMVFLFRVRANARFLQAPEQEQDEHNDEDDADQSAGTITPGTCVGPRWEDAKKNQNQDDQQNGAKTHDLLLCISPRSLLRMYED